MAVTLAQKSNAFKILDSYDGPNPYVRYLSRAIKSDKNFVLNDFHFEFIINNHNFAPMTINKMVKVADWWGEKKKEDWGLDFTPEKIIISTYIGETENFYAFYCWYRKSQPSAELCIASKRGILTDFTSQDFNEIDVNFHKYNEKSGRIMKPYQEEGVKFLLARKKAILASEMGSGKSMTAIVAALEDDYKHILIISPASVKTTWMNELKLLVPEDDITIVSGSKWKDNRFTIINYDILDNFYEVPTEIVKKREIEVDENGKGHYVYKEKEVVSRKKEVIAKAMENSQLFQSKFDLIIIDEAHRLSNTTSGRYKIVSDLVKRSSPRGIYELTGTPITNRPINFFNMLKIIDAPVAKDWKYYVMRYCDGKEMFLKKDRDAYTKMFLTRKGKNTWYDLTPHEKDELNAELETKCRKITLNQGASNLEELKEVVKPYYLRRLKSDFGKMSEKRVKMLSYELSSEQRKSYERVWEEYKTAKENEKDVEDIEKYRKITEGIMMRQWLSSEMVPYTVKLAKQCLATGRKVVIFCSFDDELYRLQEEFNDICVIHNGKLTPKKKDKAVNDFQNNPEIKVFIGNIQSAGVGITLTSATVAIFNSFSWVSGDNLQAEDRIHRLNQKNDVTVYYQVFKDTFYEEMFDKVMNKQNIINKIIVKEAEK